MSSVLRRGMGVSMPGLGQQTRAERLAGERAAEAKQQKEDSKYGPTTENLGGYWEAGAQISDLGIVEKAHDPNDKTGKAYKLLQRPYMAGEGIGETQQSPIMRMQSQQAAGMAVGGGSSNELLQKYQQLVMDFNKYKDDTDRLIKDLYQRMDSIGGNKQAGTLGKGRT